jgi:CheY-like chemotaxis protein
MVKSSADYLLAVINDILDFSKIEAGKLDLETIDFNVRNLLDDTMAALALRAHKKGLELACHVMGDVPSQLVGDPGRLRQILMNLVGNAIKFTDQGEVIVRVTREEADGGPARLHVSVTDSGIGIPASKLGILFQAFSQVDTSNTRKYGGTGLGLAISARLVAMMHGRIWVESEQGQGSTFHFTAEFGLSAQPQEDVELGPLDTTGLPVLIVDDHPTNRLILVETLTRWRMRPTAVASGAEALAAVDDARRRGEPFALVLLDAMMPEMDGFTLAAKLQAQPDVPAPTLMMLSSADRQTGATRCRDLGLASYLTKPVRQSDLLDAITAALAKSSAELAKQYRPQPVKEMGPCVRPLRLLLAEDNPVNQRFAVRILEKRGHTVVVATNGREALDLRRREAFDAVLMDVQMPEMDGFEAAAAMRAYERAEGGHVPIIAMTAHAMKGDKERCLAAGMDAYVSKPLQAREFLNVVEGQASPDGAGEPGDGQSAAVFDREQTLDRVAGDRALLKEIVELFLESAPESIDELRRAIAKGDAAALERAAHSLKGAVGNFGARATQAAALRLETMGRTKDLTHAEEAFALLAEELARLQPALSAFASEEESLTPA